MIRFYVFEIQLYKYIQLLRCKQEINKQQIIVRHS